MECLLIKIVISALIWNSVQCLLFMFNILQCSYSTFNMKWNVHFKQIQQFVNFLLFSDLREMDWWASLLTVCWKLFAKRLQSPQPTEWKVGKTKLILASELGLMFCGWISFFNLETVPSLKYWLLARMCHRGLPRLKLKVENSFILFFLTTKKLLDDGRHEEGCGDQAGGE